MYNHKCDHCGETFILPISKEEILKNVMENLWVSI